MQPFLQPQIPLRFYCMPWSWNPLPNKKVMMEKVVLYRFSREPVLVCDMKHKDFFLFKTGFLQCCSVFFSNLSLVWGTKQTLSRQHQMFSSRQTATIPFECHTQICVWRLWTCSEYPLGKANGQRYALNVTFFVFWSHLPERWSTTAFLN